MNKINNLTDANLKTFLFEGEDVKIKFKGTQPEITGKISFGKRNVYFNHSNRVWQGGGISKYGYDYSYALTGWLYTIESFELIPATPKQMFKVNDIVHQKVVCNPNDIKILDMTDNLVFLSQENQFDYVGNTITKDQLYKHYVKKGFNNDKKTYTVDDIHMAYHCGFSNGYSNNGTLSVQKNWEFFIKTL